LAPSLDTREDLIQSVREVNSDFFRIQSLQHILYYSLRPKNDLQCIPGHLTLVPERNELKNQYNLPSNVNILLATTHEYQHHTLCHINNTSSFRFQSILSFIEQAIDGAMQIELNSFGFNLHLPPSAPPYEAIYPSLV